MLESTAPACPSRGHFGESQQIMSWRPGRVLAGAGWIVPRRVAHAAHAAHARDAFGRRTTLDSISQRNFDNTVTAEGGETPGKQARTGAVRLARPGRDIYQWRGDVARQVGGDKLYPPRGQVGAADRQQARRTVCVPNRPARTSRADSKQKQKGNGRKSFRVLPTGLFSSSCEIKRPAPGVLQQHGLSLETDYGEIKSSAGKVCDSLTWRRIPSATRRLDKVARQEREQVRARSAKSARLFARPFNY